MTIDTFSWCVRVEASEELAISTLQAQFGDGYKQVASKGINPASEKWSLNISGRPASMAEARSFLKNHVSNSCWWVNPWGEKKLYRVKSDSINTKFSNGEWVEITFIFEQAFAP